MQQTCVPESQHHVHVEYSCMERLPRVLCSSHCALPPMLVKGESPSAHASHFAKTMVNCNWWKLICSSRSLRRVRVAATHRRHRERHGTRPVRMHVRLVHRKSAPTMRVLCGLTALGLARHRASAVSCTITEHALRVRARNDAGIDFPNTISQSKHGLFSGSQVVSKNF